MIECSDVYEQERPVNRGVNEVVYFYKQPTSKQLQLQMQLKKEYPAWFESFSILLNDAALDFLHNIRTTDEYIRHVIDLKDNPYLEATIEENKAVFLVMKQAFKDYLDFLNSSKQEIILILDTNALIKNHDFTTYKEITGTDKFTVIIVSTVIKELDGLKIKNLDPEFRKKVEKVFTYLGGLRKQGSMLEGVTVDHTITVKMRAKEPSHDVLRSDIDLANMDDRILQTMLEIQRDNPSSTIILVTSDMNLQNKAEMFDLPYVETPKKQEIEKATVKKLGEQEKRFVTSIKMEIQKNQEAVSLFPNWIMTDSFSDYTWGESKDLTDKLSFVYYDSLRNNFLHKIFEEKDEGEILTLYSMLSRFKQRVEDSLSTYIKGHYKYGSQESRDLTIKLRFATKELFEQFKKVDEILKKW